MREEDELSTPGTSGPGTPGKTPGTSGPDETRPGTSGSSNTPTTREDDIINRVLSRADSSLTAAELAADDDTNFDVQERAALRRVAGLSTELEDVTEVEYRDVRLENVVLAGVYTEGTAEAAEDSLRELAALAETAGSTVLDGVIQRRDTPDPATYLGRGKARELAEIVNAVGADTVIFDSELAPSQRRALEDVVKVKVVDRVALILDIFAQHAKSREGKAQVELAQLEYLLPRLRGWGESMSRQAGGQVAGGAGIGSRGPGETQIELDRRRIRKRMAKLRRDIAKMTPAREVKRSSRKRNRIPSVAIVGYTNAGKSSLLNRLTDAGVMVQNVLFATLDPTVRAAEAEDGRTYTLTDTVGFVRNLPHQLVEAFRSSLEEAGQADVLLHVVDGSHPDPEGQIAAVHDVLADVVDPSVPELIVINKADIAEPDAVARLMRRHPGAVAVSAHTGEGLDILRTAIAEALPHPEYELTVLIPYNRGDLLSAVHEDGEIERIEHIDDGTVVHAFVNGELAAQLEPFRRPDMFAGAGPAEDSTPGQVPDSPESTSYEVPTPDAETTSPDRVSPDPTSGDDPVGDRE
ncbi:GTPase HflX [Brevibacterium ravenspurgense]|uniref:GTPase HflX n=1 Tax=Brevibacterium ravenspurgense TaxID=479117 RepID=A0A2I1IE98_9MICO|nr:GTPase HflX [Brevibacterium ravenspurgense]PKY69445.1 GTPase HflX [Brevibacterium ravenspurgense]